MLKVVYFIHHAIEYLFLLQGFHFFTATLQLLQGVHQTQVLVITICLQILENDKHKFPSFYHVNI